jgi:glycosyltransferase involved in cell wall biosynthesis
MMSSPADHRPGKSVTLLVPALNEISGMRRILPRVRREWVDQILVLDGGSTDGTVEYALEQGWEVYRQKQVGIRLGYIEAYDHVTCDIVVTFSPDGNSIPELLPDVIERMRHDDDCDMLIVSRYLKGAKSYDDTWLTRLGNLGLTWTINVLFRAHYTDALVLFRAWRRPIPKDIGLTEVRSKFYERWIGRFISWEPQLSIRCAQYGYTMREIPGDEPKRVEDEMRGAAFLPTSRIFHFKSGFACLYTILEEFIRGWSRRRRR